MTHFLERYTYFPPIEVVGKFLPAFFIHSTVSGKEKCIKMRGAEKIDWLDFFFKKMFGCLVLGPPGTGKSSFCFGLWQLMGNGNRECAIINLDPANDQLM